MGHGARTPLAEGERAALHGVHGGLRAALRQLPQVTRQCYALFFFALLVMAITSKQLPVRTARLLACASAAGIAITHYTSAYFAALAVLLGCAFTYLLRTERAQRVLTLPVTAVIVGIVALWDAAVAKSQSNVVQLFSAIRKDGLRLLPGKGSVWTGSSMDRPGRSAACSTVPSSDASARL